MNSEAEFNGVGRGGFNDELMSLRVCLVNFQVDADSRSSVLEDEVEEILLPDGNKELKVEKNFFGMLPNEIITKILSYLTLRELCHFVAPVCRQWHIYAMNPLLWQRLPFEEIYNVSPENLLILIKSKCTLLKDLNLKCQSELSLCECQIIAQSCPMLETLSLAFCTQVSKEIIKSFVAYCPKIQNLNIEGCCKVYDDSLFLLQNIPLKRLNVSHCTHLSDKGLVFIGKHCPLIRDINFDGVQWISDDAVATLVDGCYDHLCNIWLDGADLCDDSIRILARCRNLRTLSFSFCDLLSDDALKWIQRMRCLKYLRLKKGPEFSSYGLTELFKELHYSSMDDGKGLIQLDLPECSEVDDAVLTTVAKSCPNLVTIDLSWCCDVTDYGLDMVIMHCSKLKTLCLLGLHRLEGEPLKQVFKRLPKLKTLDARQCNMISDELLEELASHMLNTTFINYYGEEIKPKRSLMNLGLEKKLCW